MAKSLNEKGIPVTNMRMTSIKSVSVQEAIVKQTLVEQNGMNLKQANGAVNPMPMPKCPDCGNDC